MTDKVIAGARTAGKPSQLVAVIDNTLPAEVNLNNPPLPSLDRPGENLAFGPFPQPRWRMPSRSRV